MANRVSWSPSTTKRFLEYILEEKNSANWSGKSPTKRGYNNVANKIRQTAGLEYNYSQLKNKFDSLRTTFHLYHNMFSGQTGAGYNFACGTITMPDSWWESKIRENDAYKKFMRHGLEHGELMYLVYSDSSATGEFNYTPTAYNPPSFTPPAYSPHDNPSGHDETGGGADTPPITPRLGEDASSPTRDIPGGSRLSGTKRKSSGDGSWNTTMENMNTQLNDLASQTEYTVKHVKDPDHDKFEKAMDMLFSLPGVVPGDRLFKLGIKVIEDYNKRNVFVRMRTDAQRIMYLEMQDE